MLGFNSCAHTTNAMPTQKNPPVIPGFVRDDRHIATNPARIGRPNVLRDKLSPFGRSRLPRKIMHPRMKQKKVNPTTPVECRNSNRKFSEIWDGSFRNLAYACAPCPSHGDPFQSSHIFAQRSIRSETVPASSAENAANRSTIIPDNAGLFMSTPIPRATSSANKAKTLPIVAAALRIGRLIIRSTTKTTIVMATASHGPRAKVNRSAAKLIASIKINRFREIDRLSLGISNKANKPTNGNLRGRDRPTKSCQPTTQAPISAKITLGRTFNRPVSSFKPNRLRYTALINRYGISFVNDAKSQMAIGPTAIAIPAPKSTAGFSPNFQTKGRRNRTPQTAIVNATQLAAPFLN